MIADRANASLDKLLLRNNSSFHTGTLDQGESGSVTWITFLHLTWKRDAEAKSGFTWLMLGEDR